MASLPSTLKGFIEGGVLGLKEFWRIRFTANMAKSNPIRFPPKVRALLNAAVLALQDPARPVPDLSPITEWLEVDGWDYVVNGQVSSYCHVDSLAGTNDLDKLLGFFNDDSLLEYTDIENYSLIKDSDRIEFARSEIARRLEESMDSVHCIPVHSTTVSPAYLCMMVYFHPQGGAFFSNLEVCHSVDDYLKPLKGDIVLDADSLSDKDILQRWHKGKLSWPK